MRIWLGIYIFEWRKKNYVADHNIYSWDKVLMTMGWATTVEVRLQLDVKLTITRQPRMSLAFQGWIVGACVSLLHGVALFVGTNPVCNLVAQSQNLTYATLPTPWAIFSTYVRFPFHNIVFLFPLV